MTPGYLTKRFIQVVHDEDVVFRFIPLGKYSGVYLAGIVFIDHSKGHELSTVVHELLHHLYEKKPHKWIYEMENWWIKEASWRMKKKLLQEILYRT
jgi:hypothetical protein